MILLIDCGNTRLKWARSDGHEISAADAVPLGDLDGALAALGKSLDRGIERVLVANVAGPAVAAAIAGRVADATGIDAEFPRVASQAHGIECGYEDPSTLGIDRWLAAVAARRRRGGALVVVSAGTAVTFDAVDAQGRHLGGLILASDRLMLASLAENTSRIDLFPPAGEQPPLPRLLGRSTAEAVATGARLAVAAAIDRGVGVVESLTGQAPHVYLTGGDASALAGWLESKAEVRADLVLEGLAVVAGAAE